MPDFKIVSPYKMAGDQPEAVAKLVEGINNGLTEQTLLGVTGSGKTFTMANIIEQTQRPTLVLAHNKTLAAQLCTELREFFRTMRSSILSPTTTITSPRRISHRPIPILKRTPRSTTRSTACATPRPRRCPSGGM